MNAARQPAGDPAIPSSTRCSARTRSTRSTTTSAPASTRTSRANRSARDEVDELRESAASLALAPVDDVTAPPGCGTASRRASTDDRRPPRNVVRVRASGSRPRHASSPLGVAAAIAIVVLATSVVVREPAATRDAGDLAAAFDQATARAGRAGGRADAGPSGATVARVVLLPDGTGYLKNDGMAPLAGRADVPAVGADRVERRAGRRSRPACSAPTRARVAFHTSGDAHGVLGAARSSRCRASCAARRSRCYASATMGA